MLSRYFCIAFRNIGPNFKMPNPPETSSMLKVTVEYSNIAWPHGADQVATVASVLQQHQGQVQTDAGAVLDAAVYEAATRS